MRLRDSYRVPLLLLSCLVTALMFPRACAETRVGLGALMPATAVLTGAESRDTEAELREECARLANENAMLLDEQEARPTATDGPLANLRHVRPAAARQRVAIAARVRHRDASASRKSFLIDAGRADGVREGLAVIFGNSLVGVVSTATEHTARVVRIDDSAGAERPLRAALVTAGRRASGVARGTGDGEVSVAFLRQGDARPGDVVVTDVGNLLVPEGLVLGEVVRFGDDDRDGSFEADVRPLRDLDTLNSVLVLRDDDEAGPRLRPRTKK